MTTPSFLTGGSAHGNNLGYASINPYTGSVISAATGQLKITDLDGWHQLDGQNNYFCTVIGAAKHGEFTIDTLGNWTYIPNEGFHGTENILIRVVDLAGFSSSHYVQPTVIAPSIPVEGTNEVFGIVGETLVGDLDVTDINGIKNPNFTLIEDASYYTGDFTIDPTTGVFSYANGTVVGFEFATVRVTDNIGHTSTIHINLFSDLPEYIG